MSAATLLERPATATATAELNPLAELDRRFRKGKALAVRIPEVDGFREFLKDVGKVQVGGEYFGYSFAGREGIEFVAGLIDEVWESGAEDVTIAACGGAQIGKTVLLLHFICWATGVEFCNVGYYLPDDGLVDDVVDIKLRPQIIDQQGWFAQMIKLGKELSDSGKAVNKKGAFLVTDGIKNAVGMIRGMKKFPTTFSMDVAIEDEKDDINQRTSRFIPGRLTGSKRRLRFSIGTQRYDGAGQNKEFEEGTQHLGFLLPRAKRKRGGDFDDNSRTCVQKSGALVIAGQGSGRLSDGDDGGGVNPESCWPEVCRLQLGGRPKKSDPKLTHTGAFSRPVRGGGVETFAFSRETDNEQLFYLADPVTGTVLDRTRVEFRAQRPDRVALRKFSVRCSQLVHSGISLRQMVSRWQEAVTDPESMDAFRCDVLAMPSSTSQELTKKILERARCVDDGCGRYDMGITNAHAFDGCARFGGLDTGKTCWWFAVDVNGPLEKRVRWAEAIPVAEMVARSLDLFELLGLSGLFIDAGGEPSKAVELALQLNGLDRYEFRELPKQCEGHDWNFGDGVAWDKDVRRWRGIKCATVEFTMRAGGGMVHKIGRSEVAGVERLYPIVQVNRHEAIGKAVQQLLTPEEGVHEVFELGDASQGEDVRRVARELPSLRLPKRDAGGLSILERIDEHFLTGSKREVDAATGALGEYVKKANNHLLLAAAYARLCEAVVGGTGNETVPFGYTGITIKRGRSPRGIRATRYGRRMRG